MGAGRLDGRDDELHDGLHHDTALEEWVFAAWTADASFGVVSGYRLDRRTVGANWYWAAVAQRGEPVLHVTEWHAPARSDPLLVKAHGLWAEHVCDAPFEQWTVANETYAVALDDPQDALGRAYGRPSAVACDIEWYATGPARRVDGEPSGSASERTISLGSLGGPEATAAGFVQDGVVHGVVELAAGAVHLTEAPARRWHRWGRSLPPVDVPVAYAHTGVRAPFAFPDGTVADWVLTPDGWRARPPAPPRPPA